MALSSRSLVSDSGDLSLSLDRVAVSAPRPDEVVVRIEAAPINPSDVGPLLADADLETISRSGDDSAGPHVSARIPAGQLSGHRGRFGQPVGVGNEGAGTVIAVGDSDAARQLLGRTVAILGGPTYTQYRCVNVASCLVMPEGITAEQAAACLVNPFTVLGMLETMRSNNASAIVHTAAASNLGQMLNRACLADGVPLVNVVRRPEQAAMLRSLGATHVVDSSQPSYFEDLVSAVKATGATIAFDTVGGGSSANDIFRAMEAALSGGVAMGQYGTNTHKQVFVYGGLDRSPLQLTRSYGLAWSLHGWLLVPFLMTAEPATMERLRQRVIDEITTTFASSYSRRVSLADLLTPESLRACARMATGEKVLLTPHQHRLSSK
jgi:NADPH:quinone reductase